MTSFCHAWSGRMRSVDGFLAATKLPAALWRATLRAPGVARALVLMAEYQPAFLQVIGRHLDRHPVACKRLDPVLLHLAGGIGNDLVPGIELHAVARVGKDFGDQSFELDQLFFSHVYLQIDRRLAGSLVTVGAVLGWTALAMQKGNALDSFGLATALRRATRLLTSDLRSTLITTSVVVTARTFRRLGGLTVPGPM